MALELIADASRTRNAIVEATHALFDLLFLEDETIRESARAALERMIINGPEDAAQTVGSELMQAFLQHVDDLAEIEHPDYGQDGTVRTVCPLEATLAFAFESECLARTLTDQLPIVVAHTRQCHVDTSGTSAGERLAPWLLLERIAAAAASSPPFSLADFETLLTAWLALVRLEDPSHFFEQRFHRRAKAAGAAVLSTLVDAAAPFRAALEAGVGAALADCIATHRDNESPEGPARAARLICGLHDLVERPSAGAAALVPHVPGLLRMIRSLDAAENDTSPPGTPLDRAHLRTSALDLLRKGAAASATFASALLHDPDSLAILTHLGYATACPVLMSAVQEAAASSLSDEALGRLSDVVDGALSCILSQSLRSSDVDAVQAFLAAAVAPGAAKALTSRVEARLEHCFAFLEAEDRPLDERRWMACLVCAVGGGEGGALSAHLAAAIEAIEARTRAEDREEDRHAAAKNGAATEPAPMPSKRRAAGPRLLLSFCFDPEGRAEVARHAAALLRVLTTARNPPDVRKSASEALSMLLDYPDSRARVAAAMGALGDAAEGSGAPWLPFLRAKAERLMAESFESPIAMGEAAAEEAADRDC